MKWVKRIVFSLLALVGLAIAGLAIFIATFDVNSYKPRIQSEVEKATGRKLTLAGEASLKFSLSPIVALKDVSFANAAWSKDPQMATIGTLEVQLALLPLLDDQVVVNRLVVQDGAIVIETDAKGRGNWEFDAAANPKPTTAKPNAPAAPAAPSASSGTPTIESVTLENTTVIYRDGVTKETHTAKVDNLTFDSNGPDSPMDIAFKGIADNLPIELDAKLGSLNAILNDRAFDYDVDAKVAATSLKAVGSVEVPSQLKGLKSEIDLSGQSLSDLNSLAQLSLPSSKPFQLKGTVEDVGGNFRTKLDGQLGDSQASIDGTVITPFTAPGFDGEVSIDGKTLAEVGGLLATPLPDAGPYSVKGTVRQMGKDYTVDLKAALADTTSSLKGTFSNIDKAPGFSGQLALDGKNLSDLNALTGGGLPDRGPFSLAATASLTQNQYKLTNMTAAVEETQVTGDLSVAMDGKRPNLVATLKSPLIDLAKLSGSSADGGSTGGGGGGGAGDGRVFSADPLPLGWMETLDGIASLAVTRLVTKSVTIDNLAFEGTLSDGKLTIRKLDGAMAGGNFSATGSVAAGQGAGVALQAILRNLDAVETQKLIGMDQLLSGSRINAAFDLKGSGNSIRSIMASLNGKTDLNISAGRINNRASEVLMADLGKLLTLGGGGDNASLNCVVNRFAIQKGQAVSQVFVADTGGATIFGDGKIALDSERLDMRFAPKAKQANLVNFAVPVRVGGTLAHPTYAPDPLATAKGIAGAGLGIASGGGVGGAILGYVTGTGSNVQPGAGTDECVKAVSGTQGAKPSGDLLDNVVDGVGGAAKDVGDAIENLFGN